MIGRCIRRAMAVLGAATLTATLAGSALAADVDPAAKKKPKCQGKVATIVGTKRADVIRGTAKRDIIVARAGNDRIYAKGGNDLICAGTGNDLVVGGPGADVLWGQFGHDRLHGGPGPDFLAGQVGNDLLNGGLGVDKCFGGTGGGSLLRCELPAAPVVVPPAPPPPTLHDLSGILAIAYSDIDGLDGYSTGDVLIAQLVDTDRNGLDEGDRIEMGKYPTTLTPVSLVDFEAWRIRSHSVTGILQVDANVVKVATDRGDHAWGGWTNGTSHYYGEELAVTSLVQDGFGEGFPDVLDLDMDSPSRPMRDQPQTSNEDMADNVLIDVELFNGGSIL